MSTGSYFHSLHGVRKISYESSEYPYLLKQIPDAPQELYVMGTLQREGENDYLLSIVGTRRCSLYGKAYTKKLIQGLRNIPLTVVSGMAHGIDSIAHEAAISNGMRTVAVLGCGHHQLSLFQMQYAEKIVHHGGAVISEYPPDMPGAKHHFPERNRIVAGLSPATVIIEAPERSGALITARLALEYNRDVYALPGDIDREKSRGCNQLIQNTAAVPLLKPADVLSSYSLQESLLTILNCHSLNPDQKTVFNLLSEKENRPLDYLIKKTSLEPHEIMQIVSQLELEGYIETGAGGYRKAVQ